MVLKVISPDIFDRSEVGGRATHVKDEQQLKSEFEKLSKNIKSKVPTARITGITIQAMLEKIDHEVMLGARQDSRFGSIIIFGMGGVGAQVFKDFSWLFLR